jgi:hypothetical protein
MLIGHVQLYADHPFVFIGKDTEVNDEVTDAWTEEKPATWDSSYIQVKSNGLDGLTSVYLWTGAMPAVGEVIFDGKLHLPDSKVRIFDLMASNFLTKDLHSPNPHLLVRVDEPGNAARIDVGVNLGRDLYTLRTAPGHPLPSLISSTAYLESTAAEFGEILGDRDAAEARLAAAILLLVEREEFERLEWRVDRLREWIRLLSRSLPYQDAVDLAAGIVEDVREFRLSAEGQVTAAAEEFAIRLAERTWTLISVN